MRRSLSIALSIVVVLLAVAPAAALAAGPGSDCPPVLNGNGTVTFRYCRPATSVTVVGEWVDPIGTGSQAMTLDPTTGVWSGTVALRNNLYSYTFTVNGSAGHLDPSNLPWDPEALQSQFFVPGSNSPSDTHEYYGWLSPNNPVPHGTYHKHFIATPNSTGPFANGNHPIAVYAPPGYDPNGTTLYPVLYLTHGGGGNDVDWTTQGYAGIIEDNLIAAGLATPMVIVMPNFNNTCCEDSTHFEADGYRQDLLQAYIPFAEANYRIQTQRSGRAYAGLSQGGAYGQNIIINSADKFAYFGIWSPACIDVPNHPDCGRSPTLAELLAPGPQGITAVHFGSGDNDFFGAEVTVATEDANLTAAMIPHRLHQLPQDVSPQVPNADWPRLTEHTWNVWREELRDALTNTFFKPSAPVVVPEAHDAVGLLLMGIVMVLGLAGLGPRRRAGRIA